MDREVTAILDFWFGPLDADGMSLPAQQAMWFKSSAETDALCRERFGEQVNHALSGGLVHWEADNRSLIALILLLDQFTRNIYRNTADAFAGDRRALALATACLDNGCVAHMPTIHRVFLLMPLEHSEDIAIQNRCVAEFEQLGRKTGHQQIEDFTRYARAHRDVIARFGRFPHRNALLGRSSTPEERDHLETHGGF